MLFLFVAIAAGFTQAIDVSALDDAWALQHLLPTWPLSKVVALEQSNSLQSGDFDCVNDIATAFGALAFSCVGTGHHPGPTRDAFLTAIEPQGLVIGWPSYNEVDAIPDVSAHDKLYVVCEMSRNLALVSKTMNVALKTRNCVSKTRNCVSKTRNVVSKMMKFAALRVQGGRHRQAAETEGQGWHRPRCCKGGQALRDFSFHGRRQH